MRKFFNSVSNFFKSDPNAIDSGGYTPLQRAITNNDLRKVQSLIVAGANLNNPGSLIYPPLHLAVKKGDYLIVTALIEAGADINQPDDAGQTPLHRAVKQDQEALVLTLLKTKADPNIKDSMGQTPLHLVPALSPFIVDLLADYKARLSEQDRDGNTPLHRFLERPALTERLVMRGADVNVRNNIGVSPCVEMLERGQLRRYSKAVQKAVTLKADPSGTCPLGERVIDLVSELEKKDVIYKTAGLDELSVRDAHGNNVLHALLRIQDIPLIARVLDRAPNLVDDVNNNGLTPLKELLRHTSHPVFGFGDKYIDAAILLLHYRANPNDTDEKGRSLLHYAVINNRIDFMDKALGKLVHPDIIDRDGKTALHYAIENNNMKAMDLLLDRFANPDMTDKRGWTILDRLAEKGDRDSPIVQRLIVAGGQYQKQLPLHPEMIRRPRVLDKGTPNGGSASGPKI